MVCSVWESSIEGSSQGNASLIYSQSWSNIAFTFRFLVVGMPRALKAFSSLVLVQNASFVSLNFIDSLISSIGKRYIEKIGQYNWLIESLKIFPTLSIHSCTNSFIHSFMSASFASYITHILYTLPRVVHPLDDDPCMTHPHRHHPMNHPGAVFPSFIFLPGLVLSSLAWDAFLLPPFSVPACVPACRSASSSLPAPTPGSSDFLFPFVPAGIRPQILRSSFLDSACLGLPVRHPFIFTRPPISPAPPVSPPSVSLKVRYSKIWTRI